ncbi:MAG: hypothetical protein Q4G50_10730 [Corynebacterium sp.]|uniref:hypothetical protein n=1 Tax=Corynebacterium sp. TaxID=1720 RepID=UPI0026E104DB|nr:hypothetical protein [Corynebacterium sp.]MDO5670470.1 hypothetical protein [Corynebacterium sp.]
MKKGQTVIWHRFFFLACAGISLITGLTAALALLGYLGGTRAASLAVDHGPLMIFGFVGGAIGLERTVAVRTRWAWTGPTLSSLGVVSLLAGLPVAVPALAFTGSFLVLGAIYATVHRRQPTAAVIAQATGVIGAVSATLLWGFGGGGFALAMPPAVVFVVATIIGERLELARLPVTSANPEPLITGLVLALSAAGILFVLNPDFGYPLMGLLLVAIAVVTARVDVARRLVRARGLPRFSAVCMLAGYLWLALAGLLWVVVPRSTTGFAYDAAVHAIFLGFVISMIFAHAPIILTAVIRRPLPYHPVMYVAVALLHGGLALRLLGDARAAVTWWQIGGIINVVAVVAFVLTGVTLSARAARRKARR